MTEREIVLRERAAFEEGWNAAQDPQTKWHVHYEAATRYPLPKITRPRVLTIGSTSYRLVNGRLQWFTSPYCSGGHDGWFDADGTRQLCVCITSELATKLADLLANPTETVEDV